ncbi:type IV pilus twitching motility protein PilT [Patescibacteria group bacterium]
MNLGSKLLQMVVDKKASDLHMVVGTPPTLRIEGRLTPVEGMSLLTVEQSTEFVQSLLTPEQKEIYANNKELDFSYRFGDLGRFRVNVYHQKGSPAASLRLIPPKVPTINELRLPSIVHNFTQLRQGLILCTGPTGHGKSSTLASIIEEINQSRAEHIVTIEDPIEFVYSPQKSIISQRELHNDTHSWDVALRSALREDPDIVLVGEMRDYETIAAAITVAETGHVVLATLHTNSAAQTIDRIIDVFPEHQQSQVRMQLSNSLEVVLSQRLIPTVEGKRVPATEVLLGNSAVRNTIREGKSHQIDNIIQTSSEVGMMTLETSLAYWVKNGTVSMDVAKEHALRPTELVRLVQSGM